MIENILLFVRKRGIKPVVLVLSLISVLAILFCVYTGIKVPYQLWIAAILLVVIIVVSILKYRLDYNKSLEKVNPNVDYFKKYEELIRDVDWSLNAFDSNVRLYIYPDWVKYFHIYLMEMVKLHEFKEITDATILACLTKALIMKHDSLYYIGCFVDALEGKIKSPHVYKVIKENKTLKFERLEWKTYMTLENVEIAFGFDCVAKRIKELLSENASLMDLEEFYEALYSCGHPEREE